MKRVLFVGAVFSIALTSLAQDLNWSTLVQRQELWPASCTIKKAVNLSGGSSIKAGQKLDVVELQASQIVLSTTDGRINFSAKADDTDALAVAKEAWTKLTPAQRDLTYAALLSRTDLWPYRVAGRDTFDLGGSGKIAKGAELVLIGVEGQEVLVYSEKLNTSFTVQPRQTDLIDHARKFVESKQGAPGRVVEELRGKLIDPATAKAADLDTNSVPRYLVFYRGAGWCPPCRQFSPTLVKTYNDLKPKYPDFELVFLSDDRSLADMQRYVKEEGFPWKAVTAARLKELHLVTPFLGQSIPQLIVTDRHGKLLVDSEKVTRATALQRLETLLKQPSAQK